jgi:hypothetical protein
VLLVVYRYPMSLLRTDTAGKCEVHNERERSF